MHNITLEVTRMGIDVHNMAMRIESISSRLEFDERRSRALEGVVQYRPFTPQRIQHVATGDGASPAAGDGLAPTGAGVPGQGDGANAGTGERRRRRRRRRRRPGQTLADAQGSSAAGAAGPGPSAGDAEADTSDADFEGADDGLDSSDVPDDSDGSAS
jgi:hypothetical protein